MYCIADRYTLDPYWNLAAEDYLLTVFPHPVFRLWRNGPSIIAGRYQNVEAEINREFVTRNSIAVVRRMSGGGAVFHDSDNINYTFIDSVKPGDDGRDLFRRFSQPIIAALAKLGIEARCEGRNDLTIEGLKFSGTAVCISEGRMLHHGTLLFNTSMGNLSQALMTRPEKYEGRAVQSVRSRVTNISQHLASPMTTGEFFDFLVGEIGRELPVYSYSEADIEAINSIADARYRRDEWNFGASPRFSFSRVRRFPFGLLEVWASVGKGMIDDVEFRGDYFFRLPTERFCEALKGVAFTPEALSRRLAEIPVGEYFSGAVAEDIIALLFR